MDWPLVKLYQIAEQFISGGTPSTKVPEYWSGNIPWITGADITDRVVLGGRKQITNEAVENSATNIVPRGAILLVTRTGVGKIAKAGLDIAISQDLTGIVLKEKIDPDFVIAAISYKINSLVSLQQGSTIKGILRSDVENMEIPLPPLSEQRRIVEILDQADALRKKRAEADAKAERILPALFYKMFGDPVTNPKMLRKEKLGNLIKVKSGEFLPAKSMDPNGRYPVYGGNGVNGYHSEYMFEKPVLVIGRVGVYCGSVHYAEPKSWVTDNALYVSETSNDLHIKYLAAALRMANLNQYAGRAGQPLISASRIYPVEILVPDFEAQNQYAIQSEVIEQCAQNRRKSKEKISTLFSTLLHRAFSGALTAKWREAHTKELLAEMEEQAKMLKVTN